MAQAAWEKADVIDAQNRVLSSKRSGRWKFLVGGLLILGAIAYLILSGTAMGARYFITIDEVVNDPEYVGQTVRVSGAVLGDSITYDAETLTIEFTVVNIPQEFENLAETLHIAVTDPNATQMRVRVENEAMPDLLQNEAQAILTGSLGEDGVFHANELLLKCPSRFEEAGVDQSIGRPELSNSAVMPNAG
jgi:cytochrome c-type biogenesis protein CcmE